MMENTFQSKKFKSLHEAFFTILIHKGKPFILRASIFMCIHVSDTFEVSETLIDLVSNHGRRGCNLADLLYRNGLHKQYY
jgi:hypothetical protein